MSCIHRSHKLMDWISTYDSSLLVSLGPFLEDDNGSTWCDMVWLLCVTGTVSPPSYHFSISRFSTLIMVSLQLPKNWSTSFHSDIYLRWLCNPRFDYSKTFQGFALLHFILTAPPMSLQGVLIHSALILKLCLWEHKRSSIKFL